MWQRCVMCEMFKVGQHGGLTRIKRDTSVPTQFVMRLPPERADPGVRCR